MQLLLAVTGFDVFFILIGGACDYKKIEETYLNYSACGLGDENMNDILLIIFSIVAIIVIYFNYKRRLKKMFLRKFELFVFPKYASIRTQEKKVNSAYYQLQLPHWKYADESGTRDEDRNWNRIVYPPSSLYIENFEIRLKNPIHMINFIHYLRRNQILVKPNSYEEKKIEQLRIEKNEHDQWSNVLDMSIDIDAWSLEKADLEQLIPSEIFQTLIPSN